MTAVKISGGSVTTTPRPGLFPIGDYPNGIVGDDASGLRAAFAAAVAAGGGVIQLENKAGGYLLKSNAFNSSVLNNGDNRGFPITIQGRGVNATTLKLVNPASSLVGINPQVQGAVYSPVNLYDFTVDCTQQSSNQQGILYHYSVSAVSGFSFSTTGRHHCERVNVVNAGHANGSIRFCIKWIMNRAGIGGTGVGGAYDLPTGVLQGLRLKDCDFGTGGGGNSTIRGAGQGAIEVGAFINNSLLDGDAAGRTKPSRIYNKAAQLPNGPGNVIIDDIWIEDVDHTSGRSPVDVTSQGAPIQLGSSGLLKRCRIRGGNMRNSGDVGIEIDGGVDVVIEGVTFRNMDGQNILLLDFGMGSMDDDQYNYIIRDCTAIYEAIDEYGNIPMTSPSGSAFTSNSRFGSSTGGSILWENCIAHYDTDVDGATIMFLLGPARKQVVRNCRVVHRGTNSSSILTAMQVQAPGRPQHLVIDNFRFDRNAPVSTTGLSAVDTLLQVGCADSLRLDIKGAELTSRGLQTGTGKRAMRLLSLGAGGSEPTDNFTADELDGHIFEAGASTDYTWDATNHWYTPINTLSTERRAFWLSNLSDTGAGNLIGRPRDGGLFMQFKTGASTTGYKTGIFAKRQDATTYLEAYVYDNGTNTYLCLDKLLSGTRTSILPAAGGTATGVNSGGDMVTDTIASPPAGVSAVGLILGTRLAASTTHYTSLVVQADTAYAEHWVSAAPGNAGARPAGSGDCWASATITDTGILGSRANGETGWSQIPIDAAAQMKKIQFRRLSVLSGKIENAVIGSLDGMTGTCTGIYFQPPSLPGNTRIDGILSIENCDFRGLATSTNALRLDRDFMAGSTAFTQKLRMRKNLWFNALADTAITFVSGTAWQNQTGCWGSVYVQGGTVTKIEVSKDGTTYRDTGVTAGAFPVPPEWYIKLTQSVAPTAYFSQED